MDLNGRGKSESDGDVTIHRRRNALSRTAPMWPIDRPFPGTVETSEAHAPLTATCLCECCSRVVLAG